MNVYHSATDMKELHDNSHNYDFYVSLITNFKEKYDAKISFVVDMDKIATAKDKNSKPYKLTFKSDKVLCIYNCKIVKEVVEKVIPQYLVDRYAIVSVPKTTTSYSRNWKNDWDEGWNQYGDYNSKLPRETKQIKMFGNEVKKNHLTSIQCGNIIADLFGYEECNFYNFLQSSVGKKPTFDKFNDFKDYADEQLLDFIVEELCKTEPEFEVSLHYQFKDEQKLKECVFELANFVNEMESYYKRFTHYETIKKYINDYAAN